MFMNCLLGSHRPHCRALVTVIWVTDTDVFDNAVSFIEALETLYEDVKLFCLKDCIGSVTTVCSYIQQGHCDIGKLLIQWYQSL